MQQSQQATEERTIRGRWFRSIFFLLLFYSATFAQEARLDPQAITRARNYEPIFAMAAERHNVDARLLWVIGYLESRFNPNAVSRKGARGLMQLMPATATRYGASNPHDAIAAIDAAARYLRALMDRFGNRADLVLAAYNAGEETVEAYRAGRTIRAGGKTINTHRRITGGVPPYRETRTYVRNGLNLLKMLGNAPSTTTKTAPQPTAPVRKSVPYDAMARIPAAPPSLRLSISFQYRRPTAPPQKGVVGQP